jgi:hypothetical protein
MRVKSRYAPIIVLLLLLFVQVANAQRTDVTDDEVNDIAGELFCPVC